MPHLLVRGPAAVPRALRAPALIVTGHSIIRLAAILANHNRRMARMTIDRIVLIAVHKYKLHRVMTRQTAAKRCA